MPLSGKSALVIGAGGLGGPVLCALAAAGIGRIVLMDADRVEASDLSRQPLFLEADLGGTRAAACARRLGALRPRLAVEARVERFVEENAAERVRDADVVLDCADDFPAKFLANDTAVAAGRPLVHGGVLRTTAQILSVVPGPAGCLRCLFEGPPPAGAVPGGEAAGGPGAVAGVAGTLMAAEAVRLLSGERGAYLGRLLTYEARTARSRFVMVRRREGCTACARRPSGAGIP